MDKDKQVFALSFFVVALSVSFAVYRSFSGARPDTILDYMRKLTSSFKVPGFVNKNLADEHGFIAKAAMNKNDLLPSKTFAKENVPFIHHPSIQLDNRGGNIDDGSDTCRQIAKEACAQESLTREQCHRGAMYDLYGPYTRDDQPLGSYAQETNNRIAALRCDCKERNSSDVCAHLGTDACFYEKFGECMKK